MISSGPTLPPPDVQGCLLITGPRALLRCPGARWACGCQPTLPWASLACGTGRAVLVVGLGSRFQSADAVRVDAYLDAVLAADRLLFGFAKRSTIVAAGPRSSASPQAVVRCSALRPSIAPEVRMTNTMHPSRTVTCARNCQFCAVMVASSTESPQWRVCQGAHRPCPVPGQGR